MAPVPAIFKDLIGQEHAARFLGAVIGQNRISHAYLFLGPRGVGKKTAALRFAAALCCQQSGCGKCPSCQKAARGTHPDIEVLSPSGAFITVDQVRELSRCLSLRPYESRARVYIFDNAEAFNAESANAFLKSLEEPPFFVYFVLLAGREERVLSTLVSRCQSLRFRPLPAARIEKYLLDNFQVKPAEAAAYAHLSSGNLGLAAGLCADDGMAEHRRRYIRMAQNLAKGAWEGGLAQMLAEIVSAAHQAGHETGQSKAAGHVPEGFITAPKKRLEESAKREARAAEGRELAFALSVLESWFRDMMASAAGAGEVVLNKDYELELEDQALPSKLAGYRGAIEVIQAARAKLGYNIDVELALMAMFLKLQEVL